MSKAQEIYQSWLNDTRFPKQFREELQAINRDEAEIADRFYQDLKFGTAGLRGILGAGTNRMNYYTVARAATAYVRTVIAKREDAREKGIAISYDSRNFSREFAELTAAISVQHGLKVYFSDELRPVPMLSFAIRRHGCAGGVMITASHNPAKYNGFKVYGDDGGQLPPAEADAVAVTMEGLIDLPPLVAGAPAFAEISKSDLFVSMGAELDQAYSDYLMEIAINKDIVAKHKDMPIIYTPLHGTGNKPVRSQLARLGFTNVQVVPEQELPDGNFPTVKLPNPELPEAMEMAIQLARENNADLVMATDPDADRVGVVVRLGDGSYHIISGNEIGLLLMDYVLGEKKKCGTLGANPFVVSTIVSSRLTRAIAAHYGADLHITFTGFKFIAEVIGAYEDTGKGKFEFGYEESFGYLAGSQVRDKDAVVTCMLIGEMAAFAAEQGKTLNDLLIELYAKYGYQAERTVSIYREGKVGLEKIQNAMSVLRRDKAKGVPGAGVVKVVDFLPGEILDITTGETTKSHISGSNVLLYELEGGSGFDWFCVRPSGTEPKIKIYYGIYDTDREKAMKREQEVSSKTLAYIEELVK